MLSANNYASETKPLDSQQNLRYLFELVSIADYPQILPCFAFENVFIILYGDKKFRAKEGLNHHIFSGQIAIRCHVGYDQRFVALGWANRVFLLVFLSPPLSYLPARECHSSRTLNEDQCAGNTNWYRLLEFVCLDHNSENFHSYIILGIFYFPSNPTFFEHNPNVKLISPNFLDSNELAITEVRSHDFWAVYNNKGFSTSLTHCSRNG